MISSILFQILAISFANNSKNFQRKDTDGVNKTQEYD